jgi:transcription elongation factor GreA
MAEETHYVSKQKLIEMQTELRELETQKIPALAQRIDDARQLGDLSENAEYHAAREEMAWVQSHIKELKYLLENAEVIDANAHTNTQRVTIGSTIVVKINDKQKTYVIVGAQEADPIAGKISNESPLGAAFLGKKKGDKVQIQVPSGLQQYIIQEIS